MKGANICFVFTEWKEIKEILPKCFKECIQTPYTIIFYPVFPHFFYIIHISSVIDQRGLHAFFKALWKNFLYFLAVLGLAFKPGTDDLREAPSIDNVELLLANGAEVYAYDPVAADNFKKRYPEGNIGKGKITYVNDVDEPIKNARLFWHHSSSLSQHLLYSPPPIHKGLQYRSYKIT